MNSIRERIIQEVIRRIEVTTFESATFDKITRGEIPDDYSGEQGSVLAVLEGREAFTSTGTAMQCELEVFFAYAVPLSPDDEGQTVSNNVAGEIVKVLSGLHQMQEGGDGAALSGTFAPIAVEPNVMADSDECASGNVEFRLQYRTHARDPFALRQ